MITSKHDAYQFLRNLNAPEHLLTHVELVGEAGELLIARCMALNLPLDIEFVRIGIAIHDTGKIVHTHEMTGPGSEHEPEGQRILLSHGVAKEIARCCLSHARWHEMNCSLEELLIALSDKLWKGKRVEVLELEVIDRIAELLQKERWDIFQTWDSYFEEIADGGGDRLHRSTGD